MNVSFDIVEKYNVSGPRYTSYPTAVEFDTRISETKREQLWRKTLQRDRFGSATRGLSLYFHIPFCYSLCWYCACTKVITRNSDRGDLYLDYLEKEMNLTLESIDECGPVRQVHFGGGTPTFLRPDQLDRLGELIHKRFPVDSETEFSVEIDPRRCDGDRIEALRQMGCNRASLGVQDTNPDVQEAIHRIQPFEMTRDVTAMLRSSGINRINMDLIYGLPVQTIQSFRRTLNQVMDLHPGRLAVYSYAHLPERIPSQRLIDEQQMPGSRQKLEMFIEGIERLTASGMEWIGMDHFAAKDDSLVQALNDGTLQRNFQGYSTWAQTDLVGFGMSAISQFDSLYIQNTKSLEAYYEKIDRGQLPVEKLLRLNDDDRLRREIIMSVMCRHRIDYGLFKREWGVDLASTFEKELDSLEPMEMDGLVSRSDEALVIHPKGRLFLRNIAMVFDAYRQQKTEPARFSKTV